MKLKSRAISRVDWIIFFIVAVLCSLVFQHGDIIATSDSAYAYLEGHILDYYDYNMQKLGIAYIPYLPSTFILFALWNIPIYILKSIGIDLTLGYKVVFWYKLLPISFYLLSGFIIFKILRECGAESKMAKAGMYIFLTTPIGFFSQFIFCQYDSFTLLFMLLGIYYWIRGDQTHFSLLFGITITFKYFSLLIYIPLLLLQEKRIGIIIKNICIASVPFLAEVMVYLPSSAFRQGVFGFQATGYFTGAQIVSGGFAISIAIVAWLAVCGLAYLHDCGDKSKLVKWCIFLSLAVSFIIFGLCFWHPQWLMFMIPFVVLGALYNRRTDALLFLDVLLMAAYVLVTVTCYENNVDQALFCFGIFGDVLATKGGFLLTMRELLHAPPLEISFSIFAGGLLVIVLFSQPNQLQDNLSDKIKNIWMVRFRFIGGIAVFIVPAVICLCVLLLRDGVLIMNTSGMSAEPIHNISEQTDYRQYFSVPNSIITGIDLEVGTYGLDNHGILTVELYEAGTDSLLNSTETDIGLFDNNQYCAIDFPATELLSNKQYYLKFKIDYEAGSSIAIYRTMNQTATGTNFATIDGVPTDYNLCVCLHGDIETNYG